MKFTVEQAIEIMRLTRLPDSEGPLYGCTPAELVAICNLAVEQAQKSLPLQFVTQTAVANPEERN